MITITITGESCSASIKVNTFQTQFCTCFKFATASCLGDAAAFDCSNLSDDPCAQQDCSGTCLNTSGQTGDDDGEDDDSGRVPILGNIPIIGWILNFLFGWLF